MGDAAQAAPMNAAIGFGWSFYGFFIAAVAWVACYFLWAARVTRRERDRR